MSTEAGTTPIIFSHCCDVYKEMLKTTKLVDGHKVWEGFLTRLICQDLGFATPYYTSIRKELRRMGCIRQLRRGGSTTPSQWELFNAPTVEVFQTAPTRRTENPTILESHDQRISDLAKRVADLEKHFREGIKIVQEVS